jgi:gluconate 5-dehydrogenase
MSIELLNLKGRTALVTGSTQGLGLGIAKGLASAGATVAINGRNVDRVAATVKALKSDGFDAVPCSFDLTQQADVDRAVTALEDEHSPIDILVNNAAIVIRGPLDEFSLADWRTVMATDLEGVLLVSQRVVRGMRSRKRGKIINIASLGAVSGRYNIGCYSTAKAGVVALTRHMTLEWGRDNVQINAIGPGWFMTEMVQPVIQKNPNLDTWLKERTPAGRWGDPNRDLAGAAIFLASSASDFVNGQVLFVDGGHLTSSGT